MIIPHNSSKSKFQFNTRKRECVCEREIEREIEREREREKQKNRDQCLYSVLSKCEIASCVNISKTKIASTLGWNSPKF